MQTSLIINSTDTNGVAKAKAISNINSEATNEQLGEFAQKLTALTTNEYQGASRVIKMDITEEYSGGGGAISSKQIPTFTNLGQIEYEYKIRITYDGDGTLEAFPNTYTIENSGGYEYTVAAHSAGDADLVILANETDNYAAGWLKLHFKDDGPI